MNQPTFNKVIACYSDTSDKCWLENEAGETICQFFFNEIEFPGAQANIEEIAHRVNSYIPEAK